MTGQLGVQQTCQPASEDQYRAPFDGGGLADTAHDARQRLDERPFLVRHRVGKGEHAVRNAFFEEPDVLRKAARLNVLVPHLLASGLVAVEAGSTFHAREMMNHHDAVAGLAGADRFAHGDDISRDFMAGVDAAHPRDRRPAIPLHGIAAADAAGVNPHQDFGRADLRNGLFSHAYVVGSVVEAELHARGKRHPRLPSPAGAAVNWPSFSA